MQQPDKTLKQLKNEAKDLGFGVRKWAAMAGLPWQVVYRRLGNEKTVRLSEYLSLEKAVEQMKTSGQ